MIFCAQNPGISGRREFLRRSAHRLTSSRELQQPQKRSLEDIMVDFFEYMIGELKSKRLSKTSAVELVKQFSGRSSSPVSGPVIHPLLHRNTSDLGEQRFTSTFTGSEFFLVHHQVKAEGHAGQKVLPGAAYLEMARAAIEEALPVRPESSTLELRNILWAQPILVDGGKDVSVALWENDAKEIEYEIYSGDADQRTIHCYGRSAWTPKRAPDRLHLEQLKKEMQEGQLAPDTIYGTFARMGMMYGAGFQGITALDRGNGQVMARLQLPQVVEQKWDDYLLHPSLLDSAIQGCIGFVDASLEPSNQPRVPYAMESLRIIERCRREMIAWLRYAAGSHAGDDVVKVDIDLCDEKGNVCLEIRGFSYRILRSEQMRHLHPRQESQGELQSFVPVWQPIDSETRDNQPRPTNTLLLGGGPADREWLQQSQINVHIAPLPSITTIETFEATLKDCAFDHLLWIAPDVVRADGSSGESGESIIEQQEAGVLTVFRIIKALLRLGYGERELQWTIITGKTQQVKNGDRIQPAHAALFGLVGSLAKEYPHWKLRLLDVESLKLLSADACLSIAPDNRGNGFAFRDCQWFCQQFVAVPILPAASPMLYRRKGVYVVIGGAGGLGEVWTRFMMEHYQASVVWVGRRRRDDSIESKIQSLSALGPAPLYMSADATKFDELEQAYKAILTQYPSIHGVVHSAGVLYDQTIVRMEESQFRAGLSAKVNTSVNLDRVFGGQKLDFMLFFSSVVSFVKSPAQSNYAAGCTFKDSFAQSLQRAYPIKIMNWGYWGSVGGAADEYHNKTMEQLGIGSIEPDEGMLCLQTLVTSAMNQMAVIKMTGGHAIPYVDFSGSSAHAGQVSTTVVQQERGEPAGSSSATSLQSPEPGDSEESLREKAISYFQKLIASTLKMRPEQIEPRRSLGDYGLDSILVGQLSYQLRKAFPGVAATLLFEVKNVEGLVDYFLENRKRELAALLLPAKAAPRQKQQSAATAPQHSPSVPEQRKAATVSNRRVRRAPAQPAICAGADAPAANRSILDVAVIGLSGRYPGSRNLKEFWANLSNGINCVSEIPTERWKWEEYYDPKKGTPGKIYSRWGGFLTGIDEFDPLFFKISPKEAKRMDPQERIFLEACYHAIEDAGYVPERLEPAEKVGVFVGVMNSRYAAQPAHFSIANRISYLFNFQGPSMAVDTACSSSLTVIHLALESIRRGESECAIAGGVNLIIDPVHYLQLAEMTMMSRGNQCKAFGESDGAIDAEGVGVVVLKPLQSAQRDGDHIYGVIKSSAINAGGRTNGYTVPNPKAQSRLVAQALQRASIPAEHLSYIEAHGTGTPLGDPIEIAGLTRAFQETSDRKQFCSIGSLKSNIGHCESAAGIAGLTKVLLQLKHQQLAPSLHAEISNPEIDFSQTPFKVQKSLEPWQRPIREIHGVMEEIPRIAGISSFGAGGANAHLIVQEHLPPAEVPIPATSSGDSETIIVLSARSAEQLKQKAADLLNFIREEEQSPAARGRKLDLASMAYTLQVGREAMEERLAMVASSVEQLAEKLQVYAAGKVDIEDVYRGQVKHGQEGLSLFSTDADLQQTVSKWIASRKISKLLELWVRGLELDWSKLYGERRPRRMSLPLYPFAKERYWIEPAAAWPAGAQAGNAAMLHPLLHRNTSDLNEQRYSSTFTGEEFCLRDHQVKVNGHSTQRVLPAVVYLEMARAAIEHAMPSRPTPMSLELRNVVWVQPMVAKGNHELNIALWMTDKGETEFEIYSHTGEQEVVHCQGIGVINNQPGKTASLDVEQLSRDMRQSKLEPDSVYTAWAGMGAIYGPAFQAITALHAGDNQVLGHLRLPSGVANKASDYVLHPSMMDGALQSALGLIGTREPSGVPQIPFALESLRILSPCSGEMMAWVRYAHQQAEGNVTKLNIDLCDERGNICVQMHGLSSRALGKESIANTAQAKTTGSLLAVPVWQTAGLPSSESKTVYTEHNIVLCELEDVDVGKLASLLPDSQFLSLAAWDQKNIAERYGEYALACFKRIQTMLQGKPEGKVLFQIVIGSGSNQEQAVLAGLWGLLKTATLENPGIVGQLLLVPPDVATEELARQLRAEMLQPLNQLVKYSEVGRHVLGWQEVHAEPESPPMVFKDQGVYLITGGLGGLGMSFAKEIWKKAPQATVVLTGRSALDGEKKKLFEGLSAPAGRASYRQVDVGDLEQVNQLIAAIQEDYGKLNGILHSAGVVADNFILKKTASEFTQVIRPKVMGTYNLDQATQNIDLDFLVLFSSISGAMGNVGQPDYAAANAFMDQYAVYRNLLVAAQQRQGRTCSINWGAWQDGGMGTDAASREFLENSTGMRPMRAATGVEAFYRSFALQNEQVLVAEGDLPSMRRALVVGGAVTPERKQIQPELSEEPASQGLLEKTQDYLRREFSELLQLPSHKINPQAPLENYGIDSILAMKLTSKLETTFGPLSKTLCFEYQTIAALAGYFQKAHAGILREQIGFQREKPSTKEINAVQQPMLPSAPARKARRNNSQFGAAKNNELPEVAIIGLAGRYPQAQTLLEFWKNLQDGRDCITEIPPDRWDHGLYYDSDPGKRGKTYCKWGGFISDVDKFDPLFFNISPKEAALIDPQERLFLQTVWETMEDAGYTKARIARNKVGVYVGVMWGEYQLFGVDSILSGDATVPSSSYASIANRVSYFFDFHGPSIAVDTMCSSSLTAIHLACEALRSGDIEVAVAGGVNLSIHPSKYLGLSQGKFGASDGRCRSFGDGGDGYVPGEGVGAVLLKPLARALRDGDQIYAVIKTTALNHGGKTNGYTVPNPNAQGDLILDALKKANVEPKTLGYVETHGTGTSLGDPIEITGLMRAFEGWATEKRFCPIGSVKSNIGHLESAAGIAAITKALLQIRYKRLVPSLHAEPPNRNINFQDSPFYVQTELAEWKHTGAHPRRVGVSSFGAGGSNAHVILEEYPEARESGRGPNAAEVFVLSAKNWDALGRYAEKFVRLLEQTPDIPLTDLAYSCQVGRTPMDARLAVIASSPDDLKGKLNQWIAARKSIETRSGARTRELDSVFSGNIREAQQGTEDLVEGMAGKSFLADLMASKDLERLARFWVLGVAIDWFLLPREVTPKKISLPTYPFAKERCWMPIGQPLWAPRALPTQALVAGETVASPPTEEKGRTYFYPQWVSRPFVGPVENKQPKGPILVLDTSEDLLHAIKERPMCPAAGAVVLVKPGRSLKEIAPDIYEIDAQREEQFHELMENLKSKALLPHVVLHHCSAVRRLEIKEEVTEHLNHGVYELFYLGKALIKAKHQVPVKFLSVFSSPSEATFPLSAAIAGFFKALVLETPRYRAKVIEIQDGQGLHAETPLREKASLIWDEINDEDWMGQEIQYRCHPELDQQKCARYISQLAPHSAAQTELPALPLRPKGVYLITGGLGGLGFIFAEYLAKNFQAKLVLFGRSAPNAEQQEKLNRLNAYGAETLILQADVSKLEDMERVVREAKARFLEIHGVVHAAGVNRDAFIFKKTKEDMEAVLAPKVHGTINLDLATSGENLDFFVLFSSIAGVLGNAGQCAYGYGNRFLDSFAETREHLRSARKRSGRTLSINWPLWEEGGMRISPDDVALLEEQTGLAPLPTPEGIRYFEDFLRAGANQGIALYGIPSRIAAAVAQRSVKPYRSKTASSSGIDAGILLARTEEYLKALIGEEIKLTPDRIGSSDPLESFGIDSVMINQLNANLQNDLGTLPKTLLYQYETVQDLAQFLMQETSGALVKLFGLAGLTGDPAPMPVGRAEESVHDKPPAADDKDDKDDLQSIAIIGIHGSYPHSTSLAEYWENLKSGRDLIDLVPPTRWDYAEYYHPDPAAAADGKIYCKWGGFLADYDKFDPHFFKISPEEARVIDPQERLFLQSVWAAMEDSGYTRESLKKLCPKAGSADVGVFVGVTTNSYHLWGPEERSRGNNVSPAALPWSIANRVSYFFDFNGPSMPVDTACSSSLVAVHLACESLKNRECQVAIAGGVNLYLHPSKYQSMCQRRMLSLDGKCHSYGAGDDGFVPGEGVGTLVLKPLNQAIEHEDHIYAVIPASAFDHSGRSNGYSAPNPNSQARLIGHTLKKANIHPETLGYVEGHGTGTQLGDGIEIAALNQAFGAQTTKKQFCPIGSVKGNIGHSESASGMASLAKVILQLKHQQLVPSIHSDQVNPNLELNKSPFYLQHGLSQWKSSRAHPRRALVNSFGAGGVNACVVVEEYRRPSELRREAGPCLLTLSARNKDRLREHCNNLLHYLRSDPQVDLAGLCYTLQVGREAMEERLASVVTTVEEAQDRLHEWSKEEGSSAEVYQGSVSPGRGRSKVAKTAGQSLNKIASMWVAGEAIDWVTLYPEDKPRRIPLPTYPFARERYWISDSVIPERQTPSSTQLHPLVSYNSSTLREVSFSSTLSDQAFYARDHKVNEEGIFPGAGFLEIACIAGSIAAERRVHKITDIVWIRPLSFANGPQTVRTSFRHAGDVVEYVISSLDEESETILHSEGRVDCSGSQPSAANGEHRISLETLKAQAVQREEGAAFYDRFRRYGLNYGPSFQTIQELYVSDAFALSRLKIPDPLKSDFGQFILHPSMIDGALQTAAGLVTGYESATPHLPFALDELEILHPVRQTCYAYVEFGGFRGKSHAAVRKFNIRLLNESGDVLINFRNLFARALPANDGYSRSAEATPLPLAAAD